MSEPSLPELIAERDRLFAQLSVVGDFRRGSVSENWRRCGKPNCACAAPGHPGHGPRFLWTRCRLAAEDRRPSAGGGRGGEGAPRDRPARRVRDDGGADHRGEREDLRGPPRGERIRRRGPLRDGRGKRGLRDALAAEKSAEVGRLAAEAARALGCGNGLQAAEAVLRAGLLRLGGAMLGEALSADPGHRGPRVPCGHGHEAVFAGVPGEGHRHRARAGHPAAGLVPLRGMRARPGPARR